MRLARRSILTIAVTCTVACSAAHSGPSLGSIQYTLTKYDHCSAVGCDTTHPALQPGDTVGLEVTIDGPTPDSASVPVIRASCAVNIEIRKNGGSGAPMTLPSPATCPDSTIKGGDNWPGGGIHSVRVFIWKIPSDLPAGTYTATSKTLVTPAVDRTATFIVH